MVNKLKTSSFFKNKKVVKVVLGIVALLAVLGLGLYMVSQNMNINEDAGNKPKVKADCKGCSADGYQYTWRNGKCKKLNKKCSGSSDTQSATNDCSKIGYDGGCSTKIRPTGSKFCSKNGKSGQYCCPTGQSVSGGKCIDTAKLPSGRVPN